MKIFKKNQLAILVISLMLITAGYLNYDSTIKGGVREASTNVIDLASIGDAALVSANIIDASMIENIISNGELKNEYIEEIVQNIEETTANIKSDTNNNKDDYFAASKLERNVMYSQMIERYQDILQNSNTVTEQRMIAEQEVNKINELQNAIMISENLLTTKGFNDNIIFVNGESISVIIGKEELSQDEIAQIQNIISRELNADVENIHISLK